VIRESSEHESARQFAATVAHAFRRAVAEALRQHKLAGNPIAAWREGRVVLIPPDQIPLGPSECEAADMAGPSAP
jgi:hypothetical protein